jgi:hypothetical protein
VLILSVDKVVCFHAVLQVLILKRFTDFIGGLRGVGFAFGAGRLGGTGLICDLCWSSFLAGAGLRFLTGVEGAEMRVAVAARA